MAASSSKTAVGHSAASGIGAPGSSTQQVRHGINPAMRGYSPSKPYWKQGPVPKSGVLSKAGGHSGYGGIGASSHSHSLPGSTFGTNPNVYTRSTKHTPSHK